MATKVRDPASVKIGKASTQPAISPEEGEKIATVLGYKGLISDFGRSELATALRELDISVLHPASVTRYKRERLMEARRTRHSRSYYGYRWAWKSQNLRQYKKPVPLTALSVAARVAERVPGVQFFVEELRRERVVIDPFLYVAYKGAKYYLAHWDEAKFTE